MQLRTLAVAAVDVVAGLAIAHMAYVMALPEWYIFASDAAVYILCGVALLLVSGLAAWRDHRRRQRKNIDRVPLLPWRDIGALSLFGGLILCAFGAMGLLTG